MLPIKNEPIGLIILITSCLTSNYLISLLYAKYISLFPSGISTQYDIPLKGSSRIGDEGGTHIYGFNDKEICNASPFMQLLTVANYLFILWETGVFEE
jgi:hypothetical protein